MKQFAIALLIVLSSARAEIQNKSDDQIRDSWNHGVALLKTAGVRTFLRPGDRDHLKIAYSLVRRPESAKVVVLVPGFTESPDKYHELISDLWKEGYSVAALSLRGMGASDRYPRPAKMQPIMHVQTVHVASFSDYVRDLQYFVDKIVDVEFPESEKFFFAHSTGGLVVSYYLAENPRSGFRAAVLNSPLFGLGTSRFQRFVLGTGRLLFSGQWPPIPAQQVYDPAAAKFADETDGNHEYRWKLYNEFLQAHPALVQSMPSRRWIAEVGKATGADDIGALAKGIRVPLEIHQGTLDTYVDTKAHQAFARASTRTKLITYDKAFHSVWNGVDYSTALADTLKFYRR